MIYLIDPTEVLNPPCKTLCKTDCELVCLTLTQCWVKPLYGVPV